ncbi:S ribonuclease [Pyrus ussuriensis x Pyrus communis]|uniref:S ribonuclease n=1 Tax=Pyrus ussuriensis x Pyrus communis TaxID=2448454 RepID=A0A5N5H361_9ROSA|nr:S ribonuclease [Pyrus ussuriensis x Pyrus communis]
MVAAIMKWNAGKGMKCTAKGVNGAGIVMHGFEDCFWGENGNARHKRVVMV